MTERERFERYKAAERGIDYERFKLNYDVREENYGVRYHQLSLIASDWKVWSAATAQAVPEGFVVVPEDAAEVMIQQGDNEVDHNGHGTSVADVWDAMIQAAQEGE